MMPVWVRCCKMMPVWVRCCKMMQRRAYLFHCGACPFHCAPESGQLHPGGSVM
jgi:hypothetical protein